MRHWHPRRALAGLFNPAALCLGGTVNMAGRPVTAYPASEAANPPHEHPRIPGQGTARQIRHRAFPQGLSPRCRSPKRLQRARQLPGPLYVVKAQIHAGGRGKGKFKSNWVPDAKGGVRLAKSDGRRSRPMQPRDARQHAGHDPDRRCRARQVNRLYITDGVDIGKEYYLSMLVDRKTSGRIAMIASRPRAG